jgi:hypothetical protein
MPIVVLGDVLMQELDDMNRDTSRRARISSPAIAVVVSALALAGCRATVPIGHLLDDPYQYEGNTVKIVGEVTGSVGALGHGAYALDDGTGTLIILSDERGVPRQGARVEVTGWFRSLFTVGSISAAMMLERHRHLRHVR